MLSGSHSKWGKGHQSTEMEGADKEVRLKTCETEQGLDIWGHRHTMRITSQHNETDYKTT